MHESDAASIDFFQIEAAKQKLSNIPSVDQALLRQERLERLQAELQKRDLGGILLYDPVNALCNRLPKHANMDDAQFSKVLSCAQ